MNFFKYDWQKLDKSTVNNCFYDCKFYFIDFQTSSVILFEHKLASFKEEQLPYRSCAAIHVGAAVLVHVARIGRSEPLLDERSYR